MWLFYGPLIAFYVAWLLLVTFGGHWMTVFEHWAIAVAMAAGSYFAGSTPMGGGTIGFPILVLLFDQPAEIGRNFSFAIQSVGMVSASLYILASRAPLEWPMLRWAMLGALIGTPLGAAFIAPIAPDLLVKLVFAVIWASFGMLHFVKLREIAGAAGMTPTSSRMDHLTGLGIGLIGGATIASITGVGVDMLLYSALVLVVRADLKIAIPTSVVLMAFTSVVGLAANLLLAEAAPTRYAISPEVYANWLAAAPIVAIGAPVGAVMVRRIGRRPTLFVVSTLCILQFVWTCVHEWDRMSTWMVVATLLGLFVMNGAFHILWNVGGRLARRRGHLSLAEAQKKLESE
ncbi:MAG: sulfite exporter TauE/SafE family protein [Phycisphaerales bacterium]